MIAVVSDTHGQEDTGLRDRTEEAVTSADFVLHAGDFVTEAVLDAFEEAANHLYGVYGNVDDEAVRARLPRAQAVTVDGFRIALVHTVDGGGTALGMFGREWEADVVVFGHSHRPGYEWTGERGLLNPGSHAAPRGNRPTHAELVVDEATLSGALYSPGGSRLERFEIAMGDLD